MAVAIPVTPDLEAVAAAVGSLDLETLASRRWFASRGAVPAEARLAHAFALSASAVLALVDLSSGDRVDRYAMAFSAAEGGGGLREALEGDGTWRALASAIV